LGTNFTSTYFLYDSLSREAGAVQFVASDKYQVSLQVMDVLSRVVERRRGVATSAPASYSAALANSAFKTMSVWEDNVLIIAQIVWAAPAW
jgi:hypothetical protein